MKKLTAAEQSVLDELASGKWPKEIADERSVSISAVSKICRHAKEKLGARTTYQAVLLFALKRYEQG